MYASVQDHHVSYVWLFRNCGRVGGVIVMAAWGTLALYEFVRSGSPAPDAYLQAAALGIVFAGYIVGWWRELLGGSLAIAGTILFYLTHMATFDSPPLSAAALLAIPGVFYLFARYLEQHRGNEVTQSHEH